MFRLLLRLAIAVIMTGSTSVNAQTAQTNPHGLMSSCGRKKADCACPRIVWQIQQYEIGKCFAGPSDKEFLRACLEAANKKTTHCEVMKNAHKIPEWDRFVRKNGVLKMCGTQCNHNACFCGDPSCAEMMHQAHASPLKPVPQSRMKH